MLSKTSESNYIQRVSRVVTPTALAVNVTTPTLYTYLSSGLTFEPFEIEEGHWLELTSTDEGELLVTGVAVDSYLRVNGSNPGWIIEDLGGSIDPEAVIEVELGWLGPHGLERWNQCLPPFASHNGCGWFCLDRGRVPCGPNDHVAQPSDCDDDEDNDDDGFMDASDPACQHHEEFQCGGDDHRWEGGKSFALFGDGRFCTLLRANWWLQLEQFGRDVKGVIDRAAHGFGTRNSELSVPPLTTSQSLRYLASGCWIFGSAAEAQNCIDGSCPEHANDYPYKGSQEFSHNYYFPVWNDVQHGKDYGLDYPLEIAGVVHYRETDDGFRRGLGGGGELECDSLEACCGAQDDNPCAAKGGFVVRWNLTAFGHPRLSMGHEIGHAFGLEHVDDTIDLMHQSAVPIINYLTVGIWDPVKQSSVRETCNVQTHVLGLDLINGYLGMLIAPRRTDFQPSWSWMAERPLDVDNLRVEDWDDDGFLDILVGHVQSDDEYEDVSAFIAWGEGSTFTVAPSEFDQWTMRTLTTVRNESTGKLLLLGTDALQYVAIDLHDRSSPTRRLLPMPSEVSFEFGYPINDRSIELDGEAVVVIHDDTGSSHATERFHLSSSWNDSVGFQRTGILELALPCVRPNVRVPFEAWPIGDPDGNGKSDLVLGLYGCSRGTQALVTLLSQ